MYKPISIFIGLRYLWNAHLTNFKKILTVLSIVSISLGISSIIITISLVNGFQIEFRKNVLSFIPHLIITNQNHYIKKSKFPKNILKIKNIQHISSFINSNIFIQKNNNITIGEIISFDKKNYFSFKYYNIDHILFKLNSKENNIIIGKKLADKLNLKLNDSVNIIIIPNNKDNFIIKKINKNIFKIIGIFNTKNEIDNYQILMHTKIATKLLHYDKNYITGWRIWLKDPFCLDINKFKNINNNLIFLDWTLKEGAIFNAVQTEKYIMIFFLILILLIVILNLVITLSINMVDKQSIIAILQTQGLSKKKIMLIFVVLGSSTTIIGNILGTLISLILIIQERLLNILTNIFFEKINIAIKIIPMQVFLINIICILIAILSMLYPIWNIIQSTPSKILSNE